MYRNEMYIKKSVSQEKIFILVSLGFFLFFLLFIFTLRYYLLQISSSKKSPAFSAGQRLAVNSSTSISFDPSTCLFVKKDNSLITSLDQYQDVTVGVLTGKIGNLIMQQSDLMIQIISLDEKENYSFIINKSVSVYNKIDQSPLSLDALHSGQTIVMQFNCKKSIGNTFTIVGIGILQ